MEFLFYAISLGIIIAIYQDLKRREIDNWLNYLILVSGFAFLAFKSTINLNYWFLVYGVFSLIIMIIMGNLFYYSRIFAGGDAKLLIALSPFFVSLGVVETLENMGLFVLALFLFGSVWGLFYGLFLFVRDFKKIKPDFNKEFYKNKYKYAFAIFICFIALSFVNLAFLFPAIFLFIAIFLFAFAKLIEKNSMIKFVKSSELREGDWLLKDIKIGRNIIKSNWEGLTAKEIKMIGRYNKRIQIKDGIPFSPAFLFAIIIYEFFGERILGFVVGLF